MEKINKKFFIIGLGNPGRKYKKTRHNLGFLAIDYLIKNLIKGKNKWQKNKSGKYIFLSAEIFFKKVKFIKPETYMNESGNTLAYLKKREGLKPSEMIVIYDDLDLPFGKIRIKKKGSSGGHKGVQSIINNLKTDKFIRIKIGIANKSLEKSSREKFVLEKFTKEESKFLEEKVFSKLPEIIKTILDKGVEKAMNKYN